MDTIPTPETVGVRAAHKDMVQRLAKSGAEIKQQMSPRKLAMLQAAINLVIEATDLLDKVKRVAIYNKPDDLPDVFALSPVNVGNIINEGGESLAKVLDLITPTEFHLLHMAVGVAGEGGEILEAVATGIQNLNIDDENLTEEFGDVEFFLEGLREGRKIQRDATLLHNWKKLMKKRYPDGKYSDEAAQARADKQPTS